MDSFEKLKMLSSASELEAGEDGCRSNKSPHPRGIILTHAVLPNGKTTTLLKSLLTSVCENNCLYCARCAPGEISTEPHSNLKNLPD